MLIVGQRSVAAQLTRIHSLLILSFILKFYNLLFFVTSIAAFSFAAQRLAPPKSLGR